MPAVVVVRDLHKRYGATPAVNGVSFEIQPGEIFGLLGPNGAGKTSTIECMVGLREPDEGHVEICGVDARAQPRTARQKVGVSLQTTALQDKITPDEALRLFGSFYEQAVPTAELLVRFGLANKADARFENLSGGERQRLALALAFVNRPAVVLLDEPTAGLDPQARRDLHAHIAQMKREGCAILLSTHYLEEAEQLCDRVGIIDQGRIVAEGAPSRLVARSTAMQTVTVVTLPLLEFATVAALPGVEGLVRDATALRFRTRNAAQLLEALAATIRQVGAELIDLQVRKASLEDVFLRLTNAKTEGRKP